jgi:hypothetical protein
MADPSVLVTVKCMDGELFAVWTDPSHGSHAIAHALSLAAPERFPPSHPLLLVPLEDDPSVLCALVLPESRHIVSVTPIPFYTWDGFHDQYLRILIRIHRDSLDTFYYLDAYLDPYLHAYTYSFAKDIPYTYPHKTPITDPPRGTVIRPAPPHHTWNTHLAPQATGWNTHDTQWILPLLPSLLPSP